MKFLSLKFDKIEGQPKKIPEVEVNAEELAADLGMPFDKEVVESFAKLAIALKDRIYTYDSIISDDASGRIPSLVLWRLINNLREARHMEPIRGYFVASGRHDNKNKYKAIRDYFNKKKLQFGKKALVVTEYIVTGGSIRDLSKQLDAAKINFDVAALSISPRYESRQGYLSKIKNKFFNEARNRFIGSESHVGMKFYQVYRLSGVIKKANSESPHPMHIVKDNWEADQELINRVREDAATLANRLAEIIK